MEKKYKSYAVRGPSHSQEEEVKKTFGRIEKEKKEYENYIDKDVLSERIDEICNKLDEEGYDVISILPIIRGAKGYAAGTTDGYSWYSVSDGAVITGKKKGG